MITYSGWNLFASLSQLCKGQGLNILLNIFFNPSVNAARGIAYQINGNVNQFFTNFYKAVQPQITKYYAKNDYNNMFKLVFRSSKMSFFLIYIISLPIVIEAPYIVKLWLGQLPENVIVFVRLIIVITAVNAMASPLMTTAHATGRIALYQTVVGIANIMNIPISYVLLKIGNPPVTVFIVSLSIEVTILFLRLWLVDRLVDFPVKKYIKEVFLNALFVSILSAIIPILAHILLDENFGSTVIVCLLCILITIIVIYTIGLNKEEREFISNLLIKRTIKWIYRKKP